jgi:hypothetical protein
MRQRSRKNAPSLYQQAGASQEQPVTVKENAQPPMPQVSMPRQGKQATPREYHDAQRAADDWLWRRLLAPVSPPTPPAAPGTPRAHSIAARRRRACVQPEVTHAQPDAAEGVTP